MNRNPSPALRKKYDLARHHAWGGLGILTVVSAIRVLYPPLPDEIFIPAASLLLFYVVFWLFLTYRYRGGLAASAAGAASEERAKYEVEKARLKLEKKKAKTKLKAHKKSGDGDVSHPSIT
jgi:hypothetical protein